MSRAERGIALVATAIVGALGWLVLELGHPPAPLHADTFEDLLLARACAEHGQCAGGGASTTFTGVEQGALWLRLLAVLVGAGISVTWIHSLTFALAGLGFAVIYAQLRVVDRRLALATATLACLAFLYGRSLEVPWNPSLTPLPAALLAATAIALAERGSATRTIALGVALGLVVESHPVAIFVAPGAVLLAGLAHRRAGVAALGPWVVALVAGALYLALSPRAASSNARAALAWVSPFTLVALGLGTSALAVAAAPRFGALSARARRLLAATAIAGPGVVLVVGRAVLEPDGPTGPRYLAPAFVALAYLAAEALRGPLRRAPFALAAVGAGAAAFVALSAGAGGGAPRLAAMEALRDDLRSRGEDLDDAYARVNGPGCLDVLGGLAAVGARFDGPTEPRDGSLFVASTDQLRLDDARALRGRWRTLSTVSGDLVLGERDTWVDRRRFHACVWDRGARDARCDEHDLAAGVRALAAGREPLRSTLLGDPSLAWGEAPPVRARYRLAVRVPPGDASRRVQLVRGNVGSCERVRLSAVEGVAIDDAAEATGVTLAQRPDWQEGHLEVDVDLDGCDALGLSIFPPCFVEMDPGDAALSAYVGGARPR